MINRPAGPGHRGIVLGFLCALLVARAADATEHAGNGYLTFIVALFVLPFWFASGVAADHWRRLRWWLLGAQAVLTYVPFALFGSGWVGGMSGLLAGLVLLTIPGKRSWLVFGALLLVEEVLRVGVVGLPSGPALYWACWLAIAFADNGLALFGLVRLTELMRRVDTTRDEIATEAVVRQRLLVAERLRSAIDDRIQAVAARAEAALRTLAEDRDRARAGMADAGAAARQALAQARAATSDHHDPSTPGREPAGEVVLAPRLARAVLVAVLMLFAVLNVLNVAMPADGTHYPPAALPVAVVVAIAIPLLQLRHSGVRHGGARPPAWGWTFATQAVLTFVQFPFVGRVGLIFQAYLAGSALLLFASRWRWVWFGAIVAALPASVALLPTGVAEPMTPDALVRWTLYATAIGAAFGLMVYGLSRLAALTVRLAVLRAELADLAAVRERLRLARDTHDLLGLGLSAVALKIDLITALIGRDDGRARRELQDLVRICAAARGEAALITDRRRRVSFGSELALAGDVLTAAGVQVRLPGPPPALPDDVDSVLATVVREAATNILRHSAARHCTVAVTAEDGMLRLTIGNDGVATPATGEAGQGLTNLRGRVQAVAGRFEVRRDGGEFELLAEVPMIRDVATVDTGDR